MNPIYYDSINKCRVVESLYYPEPKKSQASPVNSIDKKIIMSTSEKLSKKVNTVGRKEVQFNEENIAQTTTPIFSTYFLDQNESQTNFFRKKIQSYYHENIPEQEIENIFQGELGNSMNEKDKEKLMKDFKKVKEEYEKFLKKIRLAGLADENMVNFEGTENDNSQLLKYSVRQCNVTAKESAYAGRPDVKYCYGKQSINSGYHYDKPSLFVSEEIVSSSCISEDQYVYTDSQISIEDSTTAVPIPTEEVCNIKLTTIQSEYHAPGLNNCHGYY